MSNNRYLEFDSTYRNRNEWPLPGEFEIPIAQSGTKERLTALDPVSSAVPIRAWTSNLFDTAGNKKINVAVCNGPVLSGTPFVGYTTDPNTICVTATGLQELDDYYVGCTILNTNNNISRRIIKYIFLYSNTAIIIVDQPITDALTSDGSIFEIIDPTDISDTSNPLFFVPAGRIQDNAYNSFILYNETYRQYRDISRYDSVTHLLRLDTTGTASYSSGPVNYVNTWKITDNYSIRKLPPSDPQLGSQNRSVIATTTTSVVTLDGTSVATPVYPTTGTPAEIAAATAALNAAAMKIYKNYSLRITPGSGGGQYIYVNQALTSAPIGESRTIISNNYGGSLKLTVSPPFSIAPSTVTLYNAEIMNFSYDNFNPFVYTGSTVSQQEMVCYEIELLDLILPNSTLNCGEGGRIAFYPYVYVEISNVSSSGSHLRNIIYSNNPHASRVIFRCPINDIQNPSTSTFVRIDGDGMVQTIKFKPNDNLYFRVTIHNGETYQTFTQDTASPAPPNPLVQISACFAIRRL